jgi:hypothetical protein
MKRKFTMPKLTPWLLALALVGGTMVAQTPSAKAENGQIAAGVAGGLIGGALLGGALAGRPSYAPPPTYYAPAPVYVEEDVPVCRLVRQQFWDGYGYRMRRVRVCD